MQLYYNGFIPFCVYTTYFTLPKIIDEDTFEKVEAEKLRRAQMLGRIWEHKPKENSIKKYQFAMPTPDELYDDPFKQAEYVYSLIESEAIDNDDE